MRQSHRVITPAVILLAAAVPAAAARAEDPACAGSPVTDFNGDGVEDAFTPLPDASADGPYAAGEVVVFYGGAGSRSFTQETEGVPGSSEARDRFGYAAVAGDFDDDGCDDLAVSAPFEDHGAVADAGSVWVFPGSPSGLDPAASFVYTQDSAGFPGTAEAGDEFGYALDANGAGLAIGSPGETHHAAHAGVVHLISDGEVRAVHQDVAGVPGSQEDGDRFAAAVSLDSGMLAVGVPGESIGAQRGAGLVQSFWTAAGPLEHAAIISQDSPGISGTAEPGDAFGASLDMSYVTHDEEETYIVWTVGSPGESVDEGEPDNGLVHVIYTIVRPHLALTERFSVSQSTEDVAGTAEPGDRFGSQVRFTLAANDDDPEHPHWMITARSDVDGADAEGGGSPAVQAFRFPGEPGAGDAWIAVGRYGLPNDADLTGYLHGSSGYLYLAANSGYRGYGVPWRNIVEGAADPVTVYGP